MGAQLKDSLCHQVDCVFTQARRSALRDHVHIESGGATQTTHAPRARTVGRQLTAHRAVVGNWVDRRGLIGAVGIRSRWKRARMMVRAGKDAVFSDGRCDGGGIKDHSRLGG